MTTIGERRLLERIGKLERQLTHLERELLQRTESHCQLRILPYSNPENDVRIQNAGFSQKIEDVLRRNDVFMVSQLLNLGKQWLSLSGIDSVTKDEIEAHLANNMGVPLQD